jgi:hypothetical protein
MYKLLLFVILSFALTVLSGSATRMATGNYVPPGPPICEKDQNGLETCTSLVRQTTTCHLQLKNKNEFTSQRVDLESKTNPNQNNIVQNSINKVC